MPPKKTNEMSHKTKLPRFRNKENGLGVRAAQKVERAIFPLSVEKVLTFPQGRSQPEVLLPPAENGARFKNIVLSNNLQSLCFFSGTLINKNTKACTKV